MRRTLLTLAFVGLVMPQLAIADNPILVSPHQEYGVAAVPLQQVVPIDRLLNMYTQKELQDGIYVGDEMCIACHTTFGITRTTKHRQALRAPWAQYTLVAGSGVVADYDSNGVDDFMQGLDFNQVSSVFDPYKPNAPVLKYREADDTYWIQIGELDLHVVVTQGGTGDWKQRYLVRVPVSGTADGYSNENYVSPVQYNEKTHGYVLYHPEAWYDDANMPRFGVATTVTELAAENGRSYSKKCIGCHTTGIRELYQDDNGEWIYRPFPTTLVQPNDPSYPDYDHDGIPDIVNIGCEACHGPGSPHVLAGGDPNLIVAPSDLDTEASNAICEQCHVRVKSVPSQTHDWPYRDDTGQSWHPGSGENLKDFYTDAAGRWPDGVHSKQHHQQYFDFYESTKPTFEFHPVKCVECHSPHNARGKHMIRTSIVDDGLTIPTANDNNTLCLACHATHGDFEEITKEQVAEYEENLDHISGVVVTHTNHPYAPERSMGLSRCSKCHMPKTAKSAIPHDVHAHTFEVIAPEKTVMYQDDGGMPNACAVSCHAVKVNSFGLGIDPDFGTWNDDFDVLTAEELMLYFGPGGAWWDTAEKGSKTRMILDSAPLPGTIEVPPDSED